MSEDTCSTCGRPMTAGAWCDGCDKMPGSCKCTRLDPVAVALGLGDNPDITRGVVSEVGDGGQGGGVSNTSNRALSGENRPLTSESNTSNSSVEDDGDGHLVAAARDGV